MDNLTHSLIGAAIGQAGLKRRTGLAMPALIIGANLPDVDASCFLWLDGTEHLGFRRGITHGPPAMVLLPLVLAALLWGYDRWQTGRGTRPEGRLLVRFGWLYLLALIGCLSHPLFDWFNNYGIRLLEPFSSRWFYGDTLFIIDIWVLAMLGLGIWQSRRRERGGAGRPARPARAALLVLAAYIGLNLTLTQVSADLARMREPYPVTVVSQPVPAAFWRREILWRSADRHGAYDWSLFGGASGIDTSGKPTNMADARIAAWARGNPGAEAFLFWSRMPVATVGPKGILLTDQRFAQSPARSGFTVTLKPKP